ncbi:MAG: hypothetical protein ACRCVE_09950 [Plesiomonas sp.]
MTEASKYVLHVFSVMLCSAEYKKHESSEKKRFATDFTVLMECIEWNMTEASKYVLHVFSVILCSAKHEKHESSERSVLQLILMFLLNAFSAT